MAHIDNRVTLRKARAVCAVTSLQLQSAKSGKYMMRSREIEDEIREVRLKKGRA